MSTGKLLNPGEYRQKVASCEYRKTVRTSTEKWLNQCEYWKIVESGRVKGKAGIRASTENCPDQYGKIVEWVWVPENFWIRVSTGKRWNRASTEKLSGPVQKNGWISVSTKKLLNPGEYRQKVEFVRQPKNYPDQYGKMIESVWVPENCWMRASTGKRWNPGEYRKLFGPVRKNDIMSVSTGKLLNPDKYRQKVESCEYRKTVRTSTEKWLNQCEFRKIVESGRVPGKAGIRASTENCPDQYGKMV